MSWRQLRCKITSAWQARTFPFQDLHGIGRKPVIRTAIGPASRVIDLDKCLRVLALPLHRFTCRRIRWAIAARDGIEAGNRMPSAPSEEK